MREDGPPRGRLSRHPGRPHPFDELISDLIDEIGISERELTLHPEAAHEAPEEGVQFGRFELEEDRRGVGTYKGEGGGSWPEVCWFWPPNRGSSGAISGGGKIKLVKISKQIMKKMSKFIKNH